LGPSVSKESPLLLVGRSRFGTRTSGAGGEKNPGGYEGKGFNSNEDHKTPGCATDNGKKSLFRQGSQRNAIREESVIAILQHEEDGGGDSKDRKGEEGAPLLDTRKSRLRVAKTTWPEAVHRVKHLKTIIPQQSGARQGGGAWKIFG